MQQCRNNKHDYACNDRRYFVLEHEWHVYVPLAPVMNRCIPESPIFGDVLCIPPFEVESPVSKSHNFLFVHEQAVSVNANHDVAKGIKSYGDHVQGTMEETVKH